MNAARRSAVVKVLYSSAAVVRNSSVVFTVVVFTMLPCEVVLEVEVREDGPGLAIPWAAVEEVVIVMGAEGAGEFFGC